MFDYLAKSSDRVAIRYAGVSYNYNQLLQYTSLYANFYSAKCVERVERVMFFSKNTPEYIFAIYGAFRLGAVAIPVDAVSTSRELSYMMGDSLPQIIYTTDEGIELVRECVSMVAQRVEGYAPIIFTAGDLDMSGVESIAVEPIVSGDKSDVMTIIYTSGTTGSPKGVMLTYDNLWYNVDAVANYAKIFRTDSRTLLLLPLHHIFAFAGALVAPLYSGGEIHIAEGLAPDVIIKTMKEGRVTIIIGVPRLYEGFAKAIMAKIRANVVARMLYGVCAAVGSEWLSKRVFKSVHDTFGGAMEFFVSGGAALPIETGNVFKNLGFYVLEGYGMTECAPMISFTRPGERKVGYCGRILPGCEYKVEESGELLVRGANMMKGYYKREAETADIIRDGWLHTGDTATYDERYGIKITGRIKEIIVTPNGKNINPAEIENEITQDSKIIKEVAIVLHEDILQAIVYPDMNALKNYPHNTLDEIVREDIESYNRTAMGYKRVMRYHLISQELPKTRLGKTQRFKLSELMSERVEQKREDTSSRSETFQLLKRFIDDLTNGYANGDSHFEIDLALDSLGRVSLLSFVEDSFGVVISEAELSDLATLNMLSEYIEANSDSTTLQEGDTSWDEILKSGEGELKMPKSGFVHRFMNGFISLSFALLYRLRASGCEELPKSGATIYVANHRSGLDGVFITSKLGWRTVQNTLFFAKDKHFQGGFREFMAHQNNIILMNINTNVRESMQQMYQALSQGRNIIIFPEGTRTKSGSMGEFKESFAILSSVLNIPVVPVAISGSECATYDSVRVPRLGQSIDVTFLPTMSIEAGETTQEFANRVKGAIEATLS